MAFICWYSNRACSILLWYSCTQDGISLAAGDQGFSTRDTLGANALLFHVNLRLGVAILN
jgi:hypothetical protein